MRCPRALLVPLVAAAGACTASPEEPPLQPDAAIASPDAAEEQPTSGCGLPARDEPGGVQRTIDAGPAGGGTRGYYLSIPDDYDPETRHRLVVGFPGTNWTGAMIRPYLDLEDGTRPDEIFVYLDPLWRDFEGWGNLGGWLLGPNAAPADGDEDLVFTEAVLDELIATYCIDTERVFVTGHSWGGDMAQVVGCFLGDRITASVPVAANRPYWFERSDGSLETCVGDTAVWTMFGIADDHFDYQEYPGQFGGECRDFWLAVAGCTGAGDALPYGSGEECLEYAGCDRPIRYCLYGPETGHQVPPYFAAAAMAFFRTF